MKELYPAVANRYQSIACQVSSSINHAITVAFDRGAPVEYFGSGKTAGAKFITAIVKDLSVKYGAQ